MQLPREVVVGNNTLDRIGEICKHLGFSESAFVVMGHKTLDIAGKKVMDLLSDDGITVAHMVATSCNIEDIVLNAQNIA